MKKVEIKNQKLPYLAFPWALQLTEVKEWLFISGIPPMDEMRKVVELDVIDQFRYEVERMKELLKAAGMSLSDIVFFTITVTEKAKLYEQWDVFASAYLEYFPSNPGPAGGTLRIVSGLSHPKMLVEIEAIAAK